MQARSANFVPYINSCLTNKDPIPWFHSGEWTYFGVTLGDTTGCFLPPGSLLETIVTYKTQEGRTRHLIRCKMVDWLGVNVTKQLWRCHRVEHQIIWATEGLFNVRWKPTAYGASRRTMWVIIVYIPDIADVLGQGSSLEYRARHANAVPTEPPKPVIYKVLEQWRANELHSSKPARDFTKPDHLGLCQIIEAFTWSLVGNTANARRDVNIYRFKPFTTIHWQLFFPSTCVCRTCFLLSGDNVNTVFTRWHTLKHTLVKMSGSKNVHLFFS